MSSISAAAKEKNLFETIPVPRAIINLAIPSVIGQVILVIYNMADTFFVSQTNNNAMITAVAVCMPAYMFLSAISNLFGVGGASVIARSMGEGRGDRARAASGFAIWGCLLVTALYSLGALLFLDTFVDLLGGKNAEVHAYACSYMIVTVVIGGVFTAMNTLLSHLIRAEGRSLQASIGIALGGVLNVILDPLFMFVFLAPGNEALGAALATTVSNVAALVYFIVVIALNRRKLVLSVRPTAASLRDRIPADIITTGIPACLMTLCENISYAILDNLMFAAGLAAQTGIGVAKKVNMLAHCVVRGMAQGVLPLIAYNYASGNRRRMRSVVFLSGAMSVGVSVLCTAVALLFSGGLIGIFLREAGEAREYGAAFLRILCVGAPFSAAAYTIISFFQATGCGMRSLVLALMRKGVLDIPLMFLLRLAIPVYGIVWATPIADMICCCAAAILFAVFLSRMSPSRDRVGLEAQAGL